MALPEETPDTDKGLCAWGELMFATVIALAIAAAAVMIDFSGVNLGTFLLGGVLEKIGI